MQLLYFIPLLLSAFFLTVFLCCVHTISEEYGFTKSINSLKQTNLRHVHIMSMVGYCYYQQTPIISGSWVHTHIWVYNQCNDWRQTLQTDTAYTTTTIQPFNTHIKTTEQRTTLQQYCDWYTGRWWVGCYIWYSKEGPGRAGAARPVPSSLHQM